MTIKDEIRVDWKGLEEASEVLRSIGHRSSKELYPVISKQLTPYMKEIRKDTPFHTGNLRKSIAKRSSATQGVFFFTRKPKGAHAHLVYGGIGRGGKAHPYGGGNPFLHRGVGRHRPEIQGIVVHQFDIWFEKAKAVAGALS